MNAPVKGYRAQSADAINLVNAHKDAEERLLRRLDALSSRGDIDKRWLSIARTHFEEGFMALNRAVFQPERIDIPE